MKHLFYLVWIFYFMREVHVFFNPRKETSLIRDIFKKEKEEGKVKVKWDELNPEQRSGLKNIMFIKVPAVLFKYVGLLSYNWLFFLVWIIYNLVTSVVHKELNHRFEKNISMLMVFSSCFALIEASLSLLVILNSYHLHIDNTLLFKDLTHDIWQRF